MFRPLMLRRTLCVLAAMTWWLIALPAGAAPPLKALIVDGQNNHRAWPNTTTMMKQQLEETGLFAVDIARTAPQGQDPDFQPEFSRYDVVVSNYNGQPWPAKTQEAFVNYIRNGGGLVAIHAADNAFAEWPEYNQMIGLGGWGGRTEKDGPYVYLNDQGELVRDMSPGRGGHHGPQREYQLTIRDPEHPITKGMPSPWLHVKDELYDMLRGPAENMHLLATAYSDADQGGTGRHEPLVFTVSFGKGRVVHNALGHDENSTACVGFICLLQRGAEWAATGKVTQPLPTDFPAAAAISQRAFAQKAP